MLNKKEWLQSQFQWIANYENRAIPNDARTVKQLWQEYKTDKFIQHSWTEQYYSYVVSQKSLN